jgi:hypothetical protein
MTHREDLRIAYDREESDEMNPRYFVYDANFSNEDGGVVIYKGSYPQCLVVVGACLLDPEITLQEVNEKCNGYLFDKEK